MPRFLKICSLDQWERDGSVPHCRRCNAPFSITVRRHHCRACGKIYCGTCSNSQVPMIEENGNSVVPGQRCCMECISKPSKEIEDALDAIEEQKQHADENVPTLSQLKKQQQQPTRSSNSNSNSAKGNSNTATPQKVTTTATTATSKNNDEYHQSTPEKESEQQQQVQQRSNHVYTPVTSSSSAKQQEPAVISTPGKQADESSSPDPHQTRSGQKPQQPITVTNTSSNNVTTATTTSTSPTAAAAPAATTFSSRTSQQQQGEKPSLILSSSARSSINTTSSTSHADDPVRRAVTKKSLDLLTASGWTSIRTPAHQISMPQLISSEIEFYSLNVPNTRTKAYRLTVDIDASLMAASMLLSSMDLMAKIEPEVESRTAAADCGGGVMKVSTKYKGTTVLSAREFRTKSSYHELHESDVAKLVSLGLNELPVGGYISGTINDNDEPSKDDDSDDDNSKHKSSGSYILGEIHVFAIVACAVKQMHPVRRSQQILRMNFISHSDPKGRIPAFALESPTLQDMIKRLNLFCTVIHSLDLTVCAEGDDDNNTSSNTNNNNSDGGGGASFINSRENSTLFASSFPAANNDSVNSLLALNATTTASSPSSPSLCPSRRRVIAPLLRLFNSSEWIPGSCKELGFTVAHAVVPKTRVKAHLVTCKIAASLFTFSDIVGDSSLVPIYDVNIETFNAERTINPHVASVHSAYKKAARLVEPRDFAVASAHIFLAEDDLQKEVSMDILRRNDHFMADNNVTKAKNIAPNSAYVQSALDSHMIPPKDGFLRGIVHAYGFIATADADRSPNEITVSCVSCVDPCGNIPTFVLDSAYNEEISKLKIIRQLCEEKQLKAPSKPRSLSHLESRRSSFTSITSVMENNNDNNNNNNDPQSIPVSKMTSLNASPNRTLLTVENVPKLSSDDDDDEFLHRADNSSDDSLITCEDHDGIEELERDDVLAAVIDLQRAQGWSNPSSIKNCRVETRLTAISNVQAVRTYREFRCTLETFKTKLHDIDVLKSLDSSLENIEFLLSPTHGQVVFTSHKSTSVFVSPREFCTLNCEKVLSTEEAANIGLCTPGMESAAFVSSGVDCPPEFKKHDVQSGYIRGKVYAFGYVALATPPTAKRIRVYNVALVDPCGQIPAKAIQWAIGENATKMDRFAQICEASERGEEVVIANNSSSANLAMNEHSQPRQQKQADHNSNNNNSKNEGDDDNDDDAVSEALIKDVHPVEPLLHMMTHQSNMNWTPLTSPNPQVCKVDKTGSGQPHVIRVRIEVKATLSTIEKAFKASSSATVLQKLLDEPQSISQTFKKETKLSKIKLSPGFAGQGSPKHPRLTSVVIDSKVIDKEEGPNYNLFTEGFNGGAFAFAAQSPPVDLDSQESQSNYVSFTELLGCTAVATPVNAKRVRCSFWFAETIYAPGKKEPMHASSSSSSSNDAQTIGTAFAQGVLKVAAYVESMQKEMPVEIVTNNDSFVNQNSNNNSEASPSSIASLHAASSHQQQVEQQQIIEEKEKSVDQKNTTVKQDNNGPAVEKDKEDSTITTSIVPPPSLPPRAVPLGVDPEQERVVKLLVDLYKEKDNKWSQPPREAHGCTLQDMQVPFCDKKALKMELVMRCSMFSFVRFLYNKNLIPQYDPSMEKMEEVAHNGKVKTIYTPYKQASRFITARDFAFDSTLAAVSATDDLHVPKFLQKILQPSDEVLLSSNIHSKAVPDKTGFVRGILHLYGYIVYPEGPSKIRVVCICCVDPSGRIPASLVDAAAAENCKKLVVIKNLCEGMHAQKPLVDWYFDPETGESTMAAHKAKIEEEQERNRKSQQKQSEGEEKKQEEEEEKEQATASTNTNSSTANQQQQQQDLVGGPVLFSTNDSDIVKENAIEEKNQQQKVEQQQEQQQRQLPLPRSISDGASPEQMKLLSKTIDLYKSEKWSSPPKEAHGCTLQDMHVPFCDKKALRMELVMRCSLETFGSVLLNGKLTKRYDPTLVDMRQFKETGGGSGNLSPAGKILSFHATYAQQSRFISARDFSFDSTLAILKSKDLINSKTDENNEINNNNKDVLVTAAVHNASFPAQNGFVRGILHVYGYVASSVGDDRTRVTCIACADPSGRIPAALVDAAAGESCKKLNVIRDICEEVHRSDPKKNWNF